MKNISNFYQVKDYLPLLNAILITDLLIIFLLIIKVIKSEVLKEWYREFNLSAVIADVLIIFIGFIITRYIYKYIFSDYNIVTFLLLAVFVQMIHDILFYFLFSIIPTGKNKMIDVFKKYGKEVGYKAILADSSMMIIAGITASILSGFNLNTNLIILILTVYIIPYAIYTF
jgi:hypothetical protein